MMRLFIVLSCSFLFACTSTQVKKTDRVLVERNYDIESFTGPKKKVAVTKFENATRFGKRRLGDNMSNVLITELAKTNRFILLERKDVDQILEQLSLSQSGITKGELQELQLLDADFIISGAVTHYAVNTTGSNNVFTQSKTQTAKVTADLKIIDVRTGEIVLSETGSGMAQKEFNKVLGMGSSGGYDESLEGEAFRAAVVKLTENIVLNLDKEQWTCDVVKITADKAYIDAGSASNLQLGTVLQIYKKGEAITDLSGRVIGYEESKVAEGTIMEFFGNNGAVLQIGESSEMTLPLFCRLKQKEKIKD